MNKSTIFVGMDISKDVFDIYDSVTGHFQFTNDKKGFRSFAKLLSKDHWCVMEATGCYHQQLALYLFDKGIRGNCTEPIDNQKVYPNENEPNQDR